MKKGKGFVLVELMIVIEVIILLAVMLLPALSRARESARRAACLNNLKHLVMAIRNYAYDYEERYPTSAAPKQPISVCSHYKDLGILYPTYVTALDVFTCPSSGDKMPKTRHTDVYDNKPFQAIEAAQVSYAYSYNGSGKNVTWTEAAPHTTRILADRHATTELRLDSNHKTHGRNVAFQDGHAVWVSGKRKLLTNPDHADPKISTQCWWSERGPGGSK
jgi:prepilin-type processing-associated H-X9-DG protein